MKATKKIVSVTLAIVLVALAFVMPVSAAKGLPLIIVDGIFSTELYKNYGTADEAPVFPTDSDSLTAMGKDIGGALIGGIIKYGTAKKDFDKFADNFFPVVNKYLEPIGYNPDGTPIDSTIGFEQITKPMSQYTEEEKAGLVVFAEVYAKEYGEENVYNFSYDWRSSPIDAAVQLKDFIETVKYETGVRKVNLIGYSMGASVVLAYLAANGGSLINNLVFVSPAWQGTSLAGNVVTNELEIDAFAVENFLVQLANVSATTHIAAFIISFIATYEDLSGEYFGDIEYVLANVLPRLYTDTFNPYIAGMPGFWSLVPGEDYEKGKEFIFGKDINKDLEAKIDAYNEIQTDAKNIIEDAMADGMRFGIVGGYNCQMIPVSKEFEQSDTIIDVKYWSGGATCSKYLQAHNDWAQIHEQAVKDQHNHVSWDCKVDASTCMFPENTWFIKNLQHTYNADDGSTDIIMWLLGAKKQMTVTTDKENYPQFFLHNTYKRTTKPITIDGIIGDLDKSGAVTTADARIALKIAAGQMKATDELLVLGDVDEDEKITTADAKEILYMATGIY